MRERGEERERQRVRESQRERWRESERERRSKNDEIDVFEENAKNILKKLIIARLIFEIR